MRRSVLLLTFLLLPGLAACEYEGEREWYEIHVSGPARILPETRQDVATGHDDLGGLIITDGTEPLTVYLSQVQVHQFVTITVNTIHKDAGFRTGSFSDREGDIIARVVWVLSVPVEARMELSVDPERRPADLRVQVDRDADGIVEFDVAPRIALTGEQLDPSDVAWGTNSKAVVELVDADQARVTLDYPRDVSGSLAGPMHEIIYVVYPDHPELRVYDGPFRAEMGSTVEYRIIFQNGGLAEVPALSIE